MYTPAKLLQFIPDLRTAKLWYFKLRKDRRDAKVLAVVADELSANGIELISSVHYCQEHLAHEGVMTKSAPSARCLADAQFGWNIARQCAEMDIGQAIAVKDRDIISVEAMEGTDRMIERTGHICRGGGWTLIKVARPNQDMRMDVPTVGVGTLKRLRAAGAACLAVEAERTIIVDKPKMLELADQLGIPILGMK